MIRKMIFWSVAVFWALSFISMGSAVPASAQTMELTFQHFLPPAGLMSDVYRKWGELIEKRTEGRIKIKWIWSVTRHKDLLEVGQGKADFGLGSGAYHPTLLPTISVFEHAYNASDLWVGVRATSNLFLKRMPELQKEFEANGVKWLAPYTSGRFQWFLKGTWNSSDDLKGKVGRTMGGARKVWYERMGLKPVFLTVNAIDEAMEKGKIWGFENTLALANTLKHYKVSNTLVLPNSGVVMSVYTIMNLKKFNSLSKKDQKTIIDAGAEWSENMLARAIHEKEEGLIQEWKKRGITVVYPKPEDVAKMKKIGRDAAMELAKQGDQKMGPKGQAVKALTALWDEVEKAEKELKEKGYPWK